jgi:hypothetical protein
MNIRPHHLAAAHYSIIAVFAVATWCLLLLPIEQARGQLDSMFAPDTENREFFIWLVIADLLTVIVAVTFWFKRAASYPLAPVLVFVSVVLLAWALWWSNVMFAFIYALGSTFSIWSWRRPNTSFKRDALK